MPIDDGGTNRRAVWLALEEKHNRTSITGRVASCELLALHNPKLQPRHGSDI